MIAPYLLGNGAFVQCVPQSFCFAGVCLLATPAAAGGLDTAYLRGSRAYEATPSHQIAPSAPSYDTRRRQGCRHCSGAAAMPVTRSKSVRYWYSSGRLAKDLYDDPRFTTDIVSRLTYDSLTAFVRGVRQDRAAGNLFVKGYAGISGLGKEA